MTSRKTSSIYNETYNTYSTINGDSGKYLTVPRSGAGPRSPSPISIDAELLDLKKHGKDYHVSVNLNSLISQNQIRPPSRAILTQNKDSNRQIATHSSVGTYNSSQAYLQNNGNTNGHISDLGTTYGGPRKTVLTLNGTDDTDLFATHQRLQNQKNLQAVNQPAKSNNYSSLSLAGTLPSQKSSLTLEGSGYAVKSVSSSNINSANKVARNDKVEFDLHLKGQVKEVPVQKSRTWEVVGTVPIPYKPEETISVNHSVRSNQNSTSRKGPRAIENDDDDEMENQTILRKDTTKELEDLLMSHPLIRDTPGHNVKVEREKESIGPLTDQQSEGLVNVDIITERVELVLESGQASILVKVRCERIVPLENSEDLFKKSGVRVIKSMDFDMMETDARRDLYNYALKKQNNSPGGQLDQREIFELYQSLMQLIKLEHSATKLSTDNRSATSMSNSRRTQQRKADYSGENRFRTTSLRP